MFDGLTYNGFVHDVGCDFFNDFFVLTFNCCQFDYWKFVDVEDGASSFTVVFGRGQSFETVEMFGLLREGGSENLEWFVDVNFSGALFGLY